MKKSLIEIKRNCKPWKKAKKQKKKKNNAKTHMCVLDIAQGIYSKFHMKERKERKGSQFHSECFVLRLILQISPMRQKNTKLKSESYCV